MFSLKKKEALQGTQARDPARAARRGIMPTVTPVNYATGVSPPPSLRYCINISQNDFLTLLGNLKTLFFHITQTNLHLGTPPMQFMKYC